MTPDDVHELVEQLRTKVAGPKADSEQDHMEEDAIHVAVLRAIANGTEDPQTLARIAVQTCDIEFDRWYA